MTCLPSAGDCFAILRNLCHRVFENKFSDSVSQISPTCGCASIVWSSLGCSGRSSAVQYLFVGLSGYGKTRYNGTIFTYQRAILDIITTFSPFYSYQQWLEIKILLPLYYGSEDNSHTYAKTGVG